MSARRRGLQVDLGERSYAIELGHGRWSEIGDAVARATGASRAVLVTSPEVGRRYAPRLMKSLRASGLQPKRIDVPDRDANKTLAAVARIYEGLLDAKADRSTAVVALGGGVIGDMVGFAAATFLRGIPFVQVPTTLLSMVDASVGGKTGVNLKRGKNLVGAFHQPSLVWVDLETLQSLPTRQRSAGMAEMIKHAAIWDRDHFRELEEGVDAALALDPAVLLASVRRSCEIKAEVVSRDERESGLRMLLNFGHTVGHAVESLGHYRRLHGECVAIGMVFAARRSEELGHAPEGTGARLEGLLRRACLPTNLPDYPRKAYLDALRVDKKRRDSKIRFVVLEGIGRASTIPLTPAEIVPSRRSRREL